jgi:hypothetical protein
MRFAGVRHWVVQLHVEAMVLKMMHDINHFWITQVGAIFLESQADHSGFCTERRATGSDQRLHVTISDKAPRAVVHPPRGQDQSEVRFPFEDRHAKFLGDIGVHGRFIGHDIATLQHPSERFGCLP